MVQRRYGRDGKGMSKRKIMANVEKTCVESITDKPATYCVAWCEGWSVILDRASQRDCSLWNSVSGERIQFPPLRHNFPSFSKCILSSPPTQPQCTIFFYCDEIPHIQYCQLGDREWTSQKYTDDLDLIYQDIITCNGKIYAVNIDGFIEEMVLQRRRKLKFELFAAQLPVVQVKRMQLVDSCGDLFLVMRFSVSKLEVYRMDFSLGKCVKIRNLGDRIFFLSGNYSVSLSAKEVGMKGNCIYFVEDEGESLYIFDFEDESLSVSLHQSNIGALSFSWDGRMPVLRFTDSQNDDRRKIMEAEANDTKKESEDKNVEVQESLWSRLPLDLQKSVAEFLSIGRDYMSFRAVCRRWRSLAPPCCWSSNSTSSTTIQYPWLVFFQEGKGTCSFHDPRDYFTYHMNKPDILSDCVICFSKDGWLLVSQGARSMFLFEPFTKKRIQLPDLSEDYCFNGICFSTPPPSANCIIFGTSYVLAEYICIYYLCPNQEAWTFIQFRNDRPFLPSWNNPVFFNGFFYCLGQDGSLGTFELTQGGCNWKILSKPHPLYFPSPACRHFLVSFEEELLSVFVGNLGKWINVYKLDFWENEWVNVKNLGEVILFVSQTSQAVMAKEKTMKNRIYFPVFSIINGSGSNIYHSLETCRFHTVGSDYSSRDLYDTKELLHSTWVQPRLVPAFRR